MRSCVTRNQSVVAISRPTKPFSDCKVSGTMGGMVFSATLAAPAASKILRVRVWRLFPGALRPDRRRDAACARGPTLRRETCPEKHLRLRGPGSHDRALEERRSAQRL